MLGDGEARNPTAVPEGARALIDEAAQIGKQVHNSEQASKIAEKNGYKAGAKIWAQPPVEKAKPYTEIRIDPVTKKQNVTAKFGDKTFEFERAFTAEELTRGAPTIRGQLISNPVSMGMQKIEGVSGHYYTSIDNLPEGYKFERDRATSIRFAKDASKAATIASIGVPPVGGVATAASAYVAIQEPTIENIGHVVFSRFGNKLFPRRWFSKDNAERGSAILQTAKDEYDKRKK